MEKYEYLIEDGGRVIIEVLDVGDRRYAGGILYTFRCLDEAGNTLFAIENSHGTPHAHIGGRKLNANFGGWKDAIREFSNFPIFSSLLSTMGSRKTEGVSEK